MDQKPILKICTKCKIPKLLEEFHWRNKSIGLRQPSCKKCIKDRKKQYYENNKEKILKHNKIYYQKNKDGIKACNKLYRKNNKEKVLEHKKQYYKNNKKTVITHQKQYYENNKELISGYRNQYYIKNRKHLKEYQKQYYKNYKKLIVLYQKQYRKNNRSVINDRVRDRLNTDPIFKLKHYVSTHIRRALRSNKSGRHWEDLVGYTLIDLKLHLERQFKLNMCWENYGKWHIDHCKPVSWFKKTEKELLKAWQLSNLQPMWAKENLIKGNRWQSPRIIIVVK